MFGFHLLQLQFDLVRTGVVLEAFIYCQQFQKINNFFYTCIMSVCGEEDHSLPSKFITSALRLNEPAANCK